MAGNDSGLAVSAAEVEFATELARRRHAANLSQRELAIRVAFTRPYISLAEKPGGLISAKAVKSIDFALGAGGDLVELHDRSTQARKARRRRASGNPPQLKVAGSDSNSDNESGSPETSDAIDTSILLLSHLGAGIDPLTIDDIEERVYALANQYYDIGPAHFQREIAGLRRRASDVLAFHVSSSQRKRLLVALAALTGMLAESLFAVGERTDLHCSAAIALATEAGDDTLAGWIRSTQAQIALHTGNPSGAVRYAQSGQQRSPRGSAGAVRSATYLARASARIDDKASARRAWRSAEQAWSHFGGDSSDSVFSLSSDYLACCELTVLAGLGEVTPARRLLDSEESSSTPTVGRAIREIDIGLIRILSGDIDEAVRSGQRALTIGGSRWTTPLQERFDGLLEALSPHEGAAVDELRRSCEWTSV